jgi:hypothetical protein
MQKEDRMYPFDQNNQQQYQQYAQASDSGDYSQVDPNQAAGHVQQFAQNAPPEMQQQVYGQAFQQMPQDQREQFVQQLPPEAQGQMDPNDPQGMAQGLHQMGQQDPNMLQKVWNNPMGKIAAVGIAGFAAKELLSHR